MGPMAGFTWHDTCFRDRVQPHHVGVSCNTHTTLPRTVGPQCAHTHSKRMCQLAPRSAAPAHNISGYLQGALACALPCPIKIHVMCVIESHLDIHPCRQLVLYFAPQM